MTRPLHVQADLSVELRLPGEPTVRARLIGDGRQLVLDVDRPEAFAGSGDRDAVRAIATGLAARGLRVRVVHGETHLVTLGTSRAGWWQRRLTGSRHIRLGGARGLWTSGRARARLGAPSVLPGRGLVPPATPYPLAPTFLRRRKVATTHDPGRGGDPRLVLAPSDSHLPGERQPVYRLRDGTTTIGSGEQCDIRLSDLQPLHAEVVHDADDELVVRAHASGVLVHGAPVGSAILRTGTRLQVGPWTFAYTREEYADHGRPHGGRIGGELGHQRPQPPRPATHGRRDETGRTP